MKQFFSLLILLFSANVALADHAYPWQMGFQESVTQVMDAFIDFHNLLLVIVFGVSGFVLALIAYVCLRFNKRANPIPNKFSHNVTIEVIWTLIPILILVIIVVPSFKTLYLSEKTPKSEMTIKVIGHQWYWEYVYPDHGDINFDSYMIKDADIKPGQFRLLDVDNQIVVPVNTNVKVLITSADVIHAWAVPAFGVKTDAVPGRTNETWFNARKTGVYYGQCSQLCGFGHGFMPIAVKVVSKEEFNQWVENSKKKVSLNAVSSTLNN